jgi:hypothetical protein
LRPFGIKQLPLLLDLQRTFLWLRGSGAKYIQPRPLVDSCRTLQLEYDVYSQNDAAEFGRTIFADLVAGKYGEINEYVPPPAIKVTIL